MSKRKVIREVYMASYLLFTISNKKLDLQFIGSSPNLTCTNYVPVMLHIMFP